MTVEGGGRPRPPAKTYSHFAGGERTPTDYEIATSRLHYYLGRGFEPALPLADWYRRHQVESPLRCDDWDRFRDPRQTTYAAYTALQHASEEQIDRIPDSPHDAGWLDLLDGLLPPARYLFHGFQMLAAYVGQMAPSSRITVVCALQAADEVRRVTRLARRMAAVRAVRPMFGDGAKARWEREPAWQAARKLVETMLVTYDWAEAFTAFNLCAKPPIDAFFWSEIPRLARAKGDVGLADTLGSLAADGDWHRDWSGALVGLALDAHAGNGAVLRDWIEKWRPAAEAAVLDLAPLAGSGAATASAGAIQTGRVWLGRIGMTP